MTEQAAAETEAQEVAQERDAASFGTILKEAREQRGWSIREVAARLRMPERTVQALEEAQQDALPEPTFVRGYLRLYARLLDLNEEDVVQRYVALMQGETAAAELHAADRARARRKRRGSERRGDRWLWGVTGAIAVTAAVALLAQWQEVTTLQFWQAEVEAEEERVADPMPAPLAERPAVEAPPEPSTAEDPFAPAEEDVAQVQEPPAAAASEPVSETEPFPEAGAEAVETARAPAMESAPAESATPPEPLAADAGGTAAPEPAAVDRLELQLFGDSWVEVSDGTGARLVYSLLDEGTRRSVTGVAPFRVVLGAPESVALRINDEPVDTTRFERGRVARFTVGTGDARE